MGQFSTLFAFAAPYTRKNRMCVYAKVFRHYPSPYKTFPSPHLFKFCKVISLSTRKIAAFSETSCKFVLTFRVLIFAGFVNYYRLSVSIHFPF